MKPALGVALLGLGLLLVSADPGFAQCAMCKTVLTNSPEGRSIGEQFNHAILVMMLAPYLVFGMLTLVIFRQRLIRRLSNLSARIRRRRLPQTATA